MFPAVTSDDRLDGKAPLSFIFPSLTINLKPIEMTFQLYITERQNSTITSFEARLNRKLNLFKSPLDSIHSPLLKGYNGSN